MNLIEEAHLLKQNREDLVATLNDLGFTEVNAETPLSELAEYMKWAGGLRDLRLACMSKSTKEHSYFTQEEWEALSASTKSSYIKLGIAIRAERQEFIISKDNVYRSTGATTMPWAPNNSTNVKGLTDFGDGVIGVMEDMDGEANTDLILDYGAAQGITFEAAEQARAYKASTVSDGGFDDPTKWSLPAIGQVWLMVKYKTQINAAITNFFGSQYILTNDWYWSSTEYSSAYAWYVNFNNGGVGNSSKTGTYRVRAVAPAQCRAAAIENT
jgi:hypothetical protein